jgi:hypothetical protein
MASTMPPNNASESTSGQRDYRLKEAADRVLQGLGAAGRSEEYEIANYAEVVRAEMPWEVWSGVFYSWMSLKGHLQSRYGFDRVDVMATRVDDTVHALFITVWEGAEVLAGWLNAGYPVPLMLEALGVPPEKIEIQLMRDLA